MELLLSKTVKDNFDIFEECRSAGRKM